ARTAGVVRTDRSPPWADRRPQSLYAGGACRRTARSDRNERSGHGGRCGQSRPDRGGRRIRRPADAFGGGRCRVSPATQASELIHLEFDDNKLLPALYGEHDRNLARLEQALQVAIASRGNRLAISGPLDSVEAARSALTILYDRLRRGLRVSVA